MKYIAVFLLCCTFLLSSCRTAPDKTANSNFNPPNVPGAIPSEQAEKEIKELIFKKAFINASDQNISDDWVYAVEEGYLHEMRNPRIEKFNHNEVRPNPQDLQNNIRYIGSITLTAETHRKYDISNHRKLPASEGTGLPNWEINVMHINGNWWCDICGTYKAPPTIEDIQRVLASIKE